MESLGFSLYSIRSSACSESFTFPYLFGCLLFMLCDCCGYVFHTMLNKISKGGHPCLVPDLGGKVLSFSPLSMMLAVVGGALLILCKKFSFAFTTWLLGLTGLAFGLGQHSFF